MSTSKGRKKYRIRKGRVAMAAGVLFLIIGLIVFVCIRAGKKHHNNSDTQETVDYNAVVPKGQFVKVELEDCNMYIGSELDLKCTSEPEEYASKVIWTSSDEDVVTVDGKGHIKVVGTGAAAITATYDVLADSVVVRGVNRDNEGISDDLPVYDVKDNKVIVVREAQTDDDDADREPATSGNDRNPDVTEPTSDNSAGQDGNGGTSDNIKPSQDKTDRDNIKESEAAKTYTTISEAVKNSGFQTYLDNTYIYREDGNYLGEVIVQENMTQIYVMTRTTAMDNAFKQVVRSVIPDSYEDVFARFISASKDETFSADGIKVRVVAPVNGGHMQLIIYY